MNRWGRQYLRQWLIICAVSSTTLFLLPAQSTSQANAQSKAALKAKQDRLHADLTLIGHLAASPQLMNIDYLECYLGPKDSSIITASAQLQRASVPARTTLWHDSAGRYAAYKLENSMQSPSDCAVEFSALVPDKVRARLKDVDKILEVSGEHSFDEKGLPMQVYDTRPDTKVMVYQAPGLEDINKIRVQYAGNLLGPPSAADMQTAMQYRKDTAATQQKLGNQNQASALLQAHLQSNPSDAEAHLMLADSYKAQCHINQAISEYRIALDRSGDDDDLRKRCIAGLHSLKIDVPPQSLQSQNSYMPATSPSPAAVTTPSQNPISNPNPTTSPALPIRSQERININDVGF